MRKPALLSVLVAAATIAIAATAPTASAASACSSFKVLSNDRIGAAELPAGNYEIVLAKSSGLNCYSASQLFTRFLEDYDGKLPGGWTVVPGAVGKATFKRPGEAGFSVARSSKGGGEEGEPTLGTVCPGNFTVNTSTWVGPLFFTRGGYLLYLPPLSALSCRRASVLFTRFLGAQGGKLPAPWKVLTQSATFYKPAHPQRSAFRVEPQGGAGLAS